MGGFASGNTRTRWGARPTTSDAEKIDLAAIRRDIGCDLDDDRAVWPYRPSSRIGLTVAVSLKPPLVVGIQWDHPTAGHQSATARIVTTGQPPGGERRWLECPECEKRRRALYVLSTKLGCRVCLGLAYESTRQPSWERRLDRARERQERLATRLGKPSDMDVQTWGRLKEGIFLEVRRQIVEGEPVKSIDLGKPKGMQRRTWWRLYLEYVAGVRAEQEAIDAMMAPINAMADAVRNEEREGESNGREVAEED